MMVRLDFIMITTMMYDYDMTIFVHFDKIGAIGGTGGVWVSKES